MGHMRHWQSAFELLSSGIGKRLDDTAPHVAAVDVCRTVGKWDMSLQWLTDAKTRGIPATNVSNAVSACILRCREENWATMLELLRDRLESQNQEVLADQISFGTVLAACSRIHHWLLAIQLVELMSFAHLTPDLVPLCSASAACNRAERAWEWSLHFFSLARWTGQTPNVRLHNCGIAATRQNWELAMLKLQAGKRSCRGKFWFFIFRGNHFFAIPPFNISASVLVVASECLNPNAEMSSNQAVQHGAPKL